MDPTSHENPLKLQFTFGTNHQTNQIIICLEKRHLNGDYALQAGGTGISPSGPT